MKLDQHLLHDTTTESVVSICRITILSCILLLTYSSCSPFFLLLLLQLFRNSLAIHYIPNISYFFLQHYLPTTLYIYYFQYIWYIVVYLF